MGPEEHVLVLDAGDFLGGGGDIQALKGEFLTRGLKLLDIAAVNLGEMDFLRGQAYLRHLEGDLGAPFVSANIVLRETGEPFVRPYRLIRLGGRRWLAWEVGGLRVGVFGLASNEFPPLRARPEDEPLLVLDPWETARQMVDELRPRCDLLVALSHMGLGRSHELASAFPQIDVLISGHGRIRLDGSERVGPTVIVHSRSEGKFMADLALTIRRGGRVESAQAVQLPLHDEYPEDPELTSLYREYQASLRERRGPRPPGPPLYAGAAACAGCHAAQYQHWSGTAHAHAAEKLLDRGEEHNPECLPCHTTGWAEPGGFYDFVSTPTMAGVQCETCHGASIGHARAPADPAPDGPPAPGPVGEVPVERCLTCHDRRQDPEFDPGEAVPLMMH